MRLICAWCDKVLREGSEPTSHGICEGCLRQFQQQIATSLSDPGRSVKVLVLKGEQ